MKQISLLVILFMCFIPALAQEIEKDVTIIKTGREITEREKAYGEAYADSRYRGSKKLSEKRTPRNFELNVYTGFIDFTYHTLSKAQIVEKWVCGADAVIIGKAGSKTTHLTEEETLVYSEYEITVQKIIKNNASSPIQIGNNIKITRPGGNIRFNERLIRFIDAKHNRLQKGKNYLLLLKYIPEANGYIPPDEGYDYFLDRNRATPTIQSSTKGKEVEYEDTDSLLNLVRTGATSSNCKQN